MLNKKFKKAIASVTMFATVVALSGVSMLAPISASAATTIVDGDLISSNATNSDGTPTYASLDTYIVKIVGNKKFKRLVLNPTIFNSYQHLKWENIKEVDQATVDSYTTSSLARVDGDEKVYALTPNDDAGNKSWINLTAAQFLGLPESDPDSIYTINSVDGATYDRLEDITTVAQLEAFYEDGTLPEEEEDGNVKVALSAATPESMKIPTNSSAEFTALKLSADEAVEIDSITVTAGGLGDADNIDDVAIYVDGSKVGTSKNINEQEAIFNFSNPIKISANGSKTLIIKATASAAGTYKLGIKEAGDIVTDGGSVTGSFPIYGNSMTAEAASYLGNVTLASNAGTSSNAFGEDNVLLADFTLQSSNNEATILESFRLKNGGTNTAGIIDNVKLVIDGEEVAEGEYDEATGYVTFEIDGNYKIDKGETAACEIYGDLGVANVSNTVALYVKNADDFVFVGDTYGFGLNFATATGITDFDTTAEGIVVTLTAGDFTIDMDKAATPTQDVKADTLNVVLATFKMTSNGEDATVNGIANTAAHDFEIQGTGLEAAGEIVNVEMVDKSNGAIYDVTATWTDNGASDYYSLSMDEDIALEKGETKTFEIRADFDDSIDATNTAKVVIAKTAMTIIGDESNATISNVIPASVTSAITTVKSASLTWTTTALNAKSVVPSSEDVVIYQASLEAGTVDDVKLTSFKLTTHTAQADDFTDTNITSMSAYLNGVKIKTIDGDIVEGAAGTKGNVTFSSLITADDANVIAAGETVDLVVKADFAATLTATAAFSLEILHASDDIVVKDATDGTAITEEVNETVASRAITAATQGTLKVELLTTNTKADENTLLLAGSTSASDKYVGELKFTTANEPIKVTELRLENAAAATATSSDIAEIQLIDKDGKIVASKTPTATAGATFTGLSLVLPADQATSYFIAVKAKGMNVDGDASATATQGHTLTLNISDTNGVVAKGVDSGLDITLAVDANASVAAGEWSAESVTSKTVTVSGAVLNAVTNGMADGALTGGTGKIIGKYTLAFENGANRTTTNEELKAVLDALVVTVNKSAAVELTNVKVNIDGTSNKVAGTLATLGAASTSGTSTWAAGSLSHATTGLADGGKVDGPVTLVVTADVVTTAAAGEYLQTSIAAVNTEVDYTVGGTAVANNLLSATSVEGAALSE